MAEPEDREAFWRERFDMTGAEPWTRLFRLVDSEGLPRHCIGASKRRTNVYSKERTVGTPQRLRRLRNMTSFLLACSWPPSPSKT
jgi:hypothetical protein